MNRRVVLGILSFLLASPVCGASQEPVGLFRVTYYFVAKEDSRYNGQLRDQILLDVYGCEIGRVSSSFRRALDREGTGQLADGRRVNVAERTDDGWCYADLGADSWGLGVHQIPLLPFRSVAADPARLTTGDRLFLPAFAGVELNDGSEHDGHFVVDDIGSAIRDARIDIFIGDEEQLDRFEAVVPSHGRTGVYRLVEESAEPSSPQDLLRGR